MRWKQLESLYFSLSLFSAVLPNTFLLETLSAVVWFDRMTVPKARVR